jgi:hypothetical protein
MIATKEKKPAEQGEVNPGVDVGDEIYVQHREGPKSGRVVGHGEHGATVELDGKHHRVLWKHVLGAKKRAVQHYNVVDEGEDGVIVEDSNGRRRYLNIAPEAREDKMIVKALDGHRLVLFTKSDTPFAGRAGLHKEQRTDKNGNSTTKWVRANAGEGKKAGPGQHVGFVNGEHKGHGEITSAGEHGVTVRDRADGIHRIPHGSVTHNWEGEGAPDHSPHDAPQDSGADTQQPGNDPAAATDGSQAESADGIARGLFDTSEVAKLPEKAYQPVDSWEQLSEKAPEALSQFKGMLDNVAKSLNLVTGKRPVSLSHAQNDETGKAKKEGRAPVDLNGDEYMLPEHWDDNSGYLFMGPLKGEARAKEKVASDYKGDWSQVRDMVRATIAVPKVTQIPKVLAELKKNGMELAQKPKNNLVKPLAGGYRDINLIVKMPNGLLAELQIHIKPMTLAKEQGHEPYEVSRSIEAKYKEKNMERDKDLWDPADRETHDKAMKQQEALYNPAWEKATKADSSHSDDAPNLTKSMHGRIVFLYKKGG